MLQLNDLKALTTSKSLRIKRWDYVLTQHKDSGTVLFPVKVGDYVLRNPFYFVIEQVNEEQMLYIRYAQSSEPFRIGDCYGFFGLSYFNDFKYDSPIILTEGIADWAVLRTCYPYVLCTLTAGVSSRQRFILRNLTNKLILCYDKDVAGSRAHKSILRDFKEFRSIILSSPKKDFGELSETSWGMKLLESVKRQIEAINKKW